MGGSRRTTTQRSNDTQTAAPPSWTLPGIQDLAGRVTGALDESSRTGRHTGDFIALPDAGRTAEIADSYRGSAGRSGELGNWLNGQLPGFNIAPTFSTELPSNRFELAPAQDLDGVIGSAIHPVFRQLTEQVLPGIRSSALESGAYSGDRAMSVVPGQAIRESNEAAQRLAAEIGYEDYNNRENRRLEAFSRDEDRALAGYGAETDRNLGVGGLMTDRMGMMPGLIDSVMRMSTSQGDLLRMAEDLETNRRQGEIDNSLAREEYGITRPFRGLDIATSLFRQLGDGYGTTTRSGTSESVERTGGGLGSVVQGLAGLAGLASSFPGLGQMLGLAPRVAGAGAPGGGGMPLASSIFSGQGFGESVAPRFTRRGY